MRRSQLTLSFQARSSLDVATVLPLRGFPRTDATVDADAQSKIQMQSSNAITSHRMHETHCEVSSTRDQIRPDKILRLVEYIYSENFLDEAVVLFHDPRFSHK